MNLAPEHYLLIAANLGMLVAILWPQRTATTEFARDYRRHKRANRQ